MAKTDLVVLDVGPETQYTFCAKHADDFEAAHEAGVLVMEHQQAPPSSGVFWLKPSAVKKSKRRN